MDHQPYVALPEARALANRAVDMSNRGDAAGALPLDEQVLVMVQTAHATNATPQTILDVVYTMWQLGDTKRELGDLPGAQAVLEQAVALAEPHRSDPAIRVWLMPCRISVGCCRSEAGMTRPMRRCNGP
jgi:hypothetical protein